MNRLRAPRGVQESFWPDFVAELLAYHGWDNSMLARRAEIDRSMPGRWMSGETQPTIDSIRAVCHAAEVDIREGLIAAGLFTEDELSYDPDPTPDLSKVSDEMLLNETRKRMRRHLRPEVDELVTSEQGEQVNGYSTKETSNGTTLRSHPAESCG